MESFTLRTQGRTQFVNIDAAIRGIIQASGVTRGVCHIFIPHTTAAVTINENGDPAVLSDLEGILDAAVPWRASYRHQEGNSAAHAKSSLVGSCQTLLIEEGKPVLGTWQSVYFCEFDGPRTRTVHVQVIPGGGASTVQSSTPTKIPPTLPPLRMTPSSEDS